MVGYTSWHQLLVYICDSWLLYQLLVYSCDSCLISLSMIVISYTSVQLFIMLFSCLIFAVILVITLCTLLYARALPFTHILTRSLSDDPEFVRPDIGRLVSIVQVLDEFVRFANSWSFSLFYSGTLIFLAFVSFPDSYYISSVVIPVLIYMISCVVAYMWYCSIHVLLQFRFIACFGLLKV